MSYHFQEAVNGELKTLLSQFEGTEPCNIYRAMLDKVERPVLAAMMQETNNNQSRTAEMLGMNRATLRTKLKRHNLI